MYGSRSVDAYDVATGKLAWTLGGVSAGPVSSPLLVDGRLFVAGMDQQEEPMPAFAGVATQHDANHDKCLSGSEVAGSWMEKHFGYLDVDGNGCVTAEEWGVLAGELATDEWGVFAIQLEREPGPPKVLWNYRKNVSYIPSPVVYDGVFYMVKDSIVSSLDPRTGELHKRDRLGGEKMKVYASPVAADGKVYFAGIEGRVAVVKAGAQWEVLGFNDLDDEIWASPAIVDGHLYVRTKGKLFDPEASRGPALSGFRLDKLNARSPRDLAVVATRLALRRGGPRAALEDRATLDRLLTYGPDLATPRDARGLSVLVTPRLGTISPWSSKATDIARNCGLAPCAASSAASAYHVDGPTAAARRALPLPPRPHDRDGPRLRSTTPTHLFRHSRPSPSPRSTSSGRAAPRSRAPTAAMGLALAPDEIDYLVDATSAPRAATPPTSS